MKTFSATTCTEAWLAAATHLESQPDWKDYTLVLEITSPLTLADHEHVVHDTVDTFLSKHGGHSINTVVNTIFPATLYTKYGAQNVLQRYTSLAKRIKEHPDNCWGTYALRMTGRTGLNGKSFNPLEELVEKLRKQLRHAGPMRAAYEINLVDPLLDIPIYDSTTDRGRARGGPCLSHLSFKLKPDRKLLLTAFYRSHYYVQRALGNFYGLAWLQDFVATSLGLEAAELVCVSSMATLETDEHWGTSEVSGLLKRCRKALPQPEIALTAVAVQTVHA